MSLSLKQCGMFAAALVSGVLATRVAICAEQTTQIYRIAVSGTS
jgi:hypothetical protein